MTEGYQEKAASEVRASYRTRVVRIVMVFIGVMGIITNVGLLAGNGRNADELWFQILSGMMLAGFAHVLIRGLMIGAFPTKRGIVVRNLYRSFHLRWDEIARFELKPHLLTPRMGHVVLRDGGERPITSLQQGTLEASGFGKGSTSAMIDELNELANLYGGE